jgi:hypothetical protein
MSILLAYLRDEGNRSIDIKNRNEKKNTNESKHESENKFP